MMLPPSGRNWQLIYPNFAKHLLDTIVYKFAPTTNIFGCFTKVYLTQNTSKKLCTISPPGPNVTKHFTAVIYKCS